MKFKETPFPSKLKPLFDPARYKVMHGGRGGSKCLGIGTQIIMADGSLRCVEDVAVGDAVMGPDSLPRNVLATARGVGPLWRVKQTSAMDYIVNDDHILSLKKRNQTPSDYRINKHGNARNPNGRYPSWPQVTNIDVHGFLSQSKRWREAFRGYRAGILHFPYQEVSIDPYFLGVWLGDGTGRELRITTADVEIVDYCESVASTYGGVATRHIKKGGAVLDVGFRILSEGRNPLWTKFKSYDLPNNKHIPRSYLINSEGVRLQVLAGLVDTDGTTHHNGFTIAQVNERLARDIKFLADSLGFRTSLTKRGTVCTNNGARGFAWYVSINGDTWRVPTRIPRKKIHPSAVSKNKDFLLSQVSIESAGIGEWAGFTIDGDHLFLLGDGTVTHNSWASARALLIQGAETPLRILCAREVQKSIKESVHTLLSDQINTLEISPFYQVLDTEIRGANGTKFIFAGLASHTTESVKSYEGVDRVWVEEAQTVSKRSWDILTPTIRKPGSEIWLTLNPYMITDETYSRFVVSPPPDSWVCQINYYDNPWFPEVLESERKHCEKTRPPEEYRNIWLGEPLRTADGAYYADQILLLREKERIRDVPYQSGVPVNTFWDLGYNDTTAIWFHQRIAGEDRFIACYENAGESLEHYAHYVASRGWLYDRHYLPHDAENKSLQTGKSVLDLLTDLLPGHRFEVVPRVENVLNGIQETRLKLGGPIYFDRTQCADGLTALERYRKEWSENLQTFKPTPLHDRYSNYADALRQWAQGYRPGNPRASKKQRPSNWRTV